MVGAISSIKSSVSGARGEDDGSRPNMKERAVPITQYDENIAETGGTETLSFSVMFCYKWKLYSLPWRYIQEG